MTAPRSRRRPGSGRRSLAALERGGVAGDRLGRPLLRHRVAAGEAQLLDGGVLVGDHRERAVREASTGDDARRFPELRIHCAGGGIRGVTGSDSAGNPGSVVVDLAHQVAADFV